MAGAYLKSARDTFDVIIVNVPDPQTAQLNRFYTAEFFRSARDHLAPGGLLALQLRSSEETISPDLAEFLRCINRTLREVFPIRRRNSRRDDPLLRRNALRRSHGRFACADCAAARTQSEDTLCSRILYSLPHDARSHGAGARSVAADWPQHKSIAISRPSLITSTLCYGARSSSPPMLAGCGPRGMLDFTIILGATLIVLLS